MLISYATLTEARRQWTTKNSNNTDDRALYQYVRTATSKVNLITRLEFAPRLETQYPGADSDYIDDSKRTLDIPDGMMSLSSVTLADSTVLVIDTDVRMWPRGETPARCLELMPASTANWRSTSATENDITVTGEFGWRTHYDTEAWQLSGDTVKDAGGINETITTITVLDANGVNYINDIPRFDIGQMIKINTEYMAVTDVDTDTNKLTVIRGIRGTTAAAHALNDSISVFVPEPEIMRATVLIAAYDYARRDKTDKVTFDGVKMVAGMEVPMEVATILERFIVVRIG